MPTSQRDMAEKLAAERGISMADAYAAVSIMIRDGISIDEALQTASADPEGNQAHYDEITARQGINPVDDIIQGEDRITGFEEGDSAGEVLYRGLDTVTKPIQEGASYLWDKGGDIVDYIDEKVFPSEDMAREMQRGARNAMGRYQEGGEAARGYMQPSYDRGEAASIDYNNRMMEGDFTPRYSQYGEEMMDSPNFQRGDRQGEMPGAEQYEYQDRQGKMPGAEEYKRGEFNLEDDEGYQFRLGEGQKAIQGAASADASSLSGGTIKDLIKYNQGMASQEADRAYGRYESGEGMDRANRRDYLGDQWRGYDTQQGQYGEDRGFDYLTNRDYNADEWRGYDTQQSQYEWEQPFDFATGQQDYLNNMGQWDRGYQNYQDYANRDAQQAWNEGQAYQPIMDYGYRAGEDMGASQEWQAGGMAKGEMALAGAKAAEHGSLYSDIEQATGGIKDIMSIFKSDPTK